MNTELMSELALRWPRNCPRIASPAVIIGLVFGVVSTGCVHTSSHASNPLARTTEPSSRQQLLGKTAEGEDDKPIVKLSSDRELQGPKPTEQETTSRDATAVGTPNATTECVVELESSSLGRATPIHSPPSACWAISWLAKLARLYQDGFFDIAQKAIDQDAVTTGLSSEGFVAYNVNSKPSEAGCNLARTRDELSAHSGMCYYVLSQIGGHFYTGFLGTKYSPPSLQWSETQDGYAFSVPPVVYVTFLGKGDSARVTRIEYRSVEPAWPADKQL